MLQAVGLLRTIKNDCSLSRLNKIAQTDMIRMKDAQSSPFEHPRTKKLHTSSQTSPPCKLKLSFSPPKVKNDETKVEEMTHKLPAKEPKKSPAILKLEAEIPRKEAFPSITYSQTPLCNINLSLTPTVETRIKETDNLSPEERNFLKRKWQSWKLKQYIRKMKTQSIFLNYRENSDGVFTCSEDATFSEWSPDDYNKKLYEEPGTPNRYGCCSSLVTKLKSKLHRESDCPVVSYRRF
ncbi:hypothetical protein AVEN_92404-1 [Araneus ventricosus]|uniref:Uncharacterized protein n=1 Tax=Araneus ventricosus TaxID=182803 RepID=A0A4Y2AHE7_ARAVE|nr:hypothetical protein AVEN_92404-1 [Araneus ventricosus]